MSYLGQFLCEDDPIFPSPNEPIIKGSPLGDAPNKVKAGRIPFPVDICGWIVDALYNLFNPKKPAPPKPKVPESKAGGNGQAAFPVYALWLDDRQLAELAAYAERGLRASGYRTE